jgi:hypothetical protein
VAGRTSVEVLTLAVPTMAATVKTLAAVATPLTPPPSEEKACPGRLDTDAHSARRERRPE